MKVINAFLLLRQLEIIREHENQLSVEAEKSKNFHSRQLHDKYAAFCDYIIRMVAGMTFENKPAVEIVLCKDCKHRPELADPEAERFGYNVRESDGVCPCTNADDRYYSWMPEDNWFCGDGERKDG